MKTPKAKVAPSVSGVATRNPTTRKIAKKSATKTTTSTKSATHKMKSKVVSAKDKNALLIGMRKPPLNPSKNPR